MKLKDISAIDCAYVAGLLDADGWITLHAKPVKSVNKGIRTKKPLPWTGYPLYTCDVGIVNRHLSTLEWVQSLFGGRLKKRNINRVAPHAKNWSQTYDWLIRSYELEAFLAAVYPYLRIKKRQAELALEFRKTVMFTGKGRQHKRTPEVEAIRVKLHSEARDLNHLGLKSISDLVQ